jgi:hypothetical protein
VQIVKTPTGFAYVDATGQTFLQGPFDYATCFDRSNGRADVALRDRREWCQITKSGRVLQQTCNCHQPIIAFELGDGPKVSDPALDCYAQGLEILTHWLP